MDLNQLIEIALKEDLPNDDLTTKGLGLNEFNGRCRLVAKEDLILSGIEFFTESILKLEPKATINWHFKNSELVLKNQTVATLKGNLIQIIKAERTALNFLGHFSGIATLTKCYVKQIEDTDCKILDTRKTHPLYRKWQKLAVTHGGGKNHRMNLSDAILLKENHLRIAGGIRNAVEKIRSAYDQTYIEVECTNIEEVKEAVNLKVQRILLDNMNNDSLKEALTFIPNHIETEASGNMNLERIKSVAQLGVNYISVGAITHSAPVADLSLLFDWSSHQSV